MKNRITILLSFAIGALLLDGGCDSPVSPREYAALLHAEELWNSRNMNSYSYETRSECFCPRLTGGWARVEVQADAIRRVALVERGEGIEPYEYSYYQTVRERFQTIHFLMASDDVGDLSLKFDREYGYPTEIRVTGADGVLDADFISYARHLEPGLSQ